MIALNSALVAVSANRKNSALIAVSANKMSNRTSVTIILDCQPFVKAFISFPKRKNVLHIAQFDK